MVRQEEHRKVRLLSHLLANICRTDDLDRAQNAENGIGSRTVTQVTCFLHNGQTLRKRENE